MNAHTTLSKDGSIAIPEDVRARMKLTPGMQFEIDEARGVIRLRAPASRSSFPRTTIADLRKWAPYDGPPKSVEEISGLDNETLRKIFDERDQDEDSRY